MRAFGVSLSMLVALAVSSAPPSQAVPAARAVAGVSGVVEPHSGAAAIQAWRSRLAGLERAGVRIPPVRALLDVDRFPPGLRPARGADGSVQRGVAWAPDPGVLVVPREVTAVVSGALDAVGAPYADAGDGPTAFSCDGLVHSLYRRAGIDVPGSAEAQWATGRRVAFEDAVPGDLVVVGSARYGVQSIGIVVGGGDMVVADARSASVVVAALPGPDAVLGVVRPSLGRRAAEPRAGGDGGAAADRGDGAASLSWRCGGLEPSSGGSGQAGPAGPAGRAGPAGPAQRGWAGYPNGLIPGDVLCPLEEEPHALRCDAAYDLAALSAAYEDELGESLCLTDSYRTLEMQLDLQRRKPELSATPGTSTHGWGLAVDLCGGVERFGSEEHRWMRARGPDFGWVLPAWAREGSPREEPWHWEYVRE
ncbi:NlpC/P60 family protein [Saccharomonospora azurea]|uniref:NlpC/P60 family protein n=2 Tax=Saccharomonospora azurea TaxID=40988 RepID=UPI003D923FEA